MIWFMGRHSANRKDLHKITFRNYLLEQNYNHDFIDNVAIPMASLICTCSYDAVANYPAAVLVDYFARSFMRWSGVQRAKGGAKAVVTRLAKGSDVRLNAAVQSVSRNVNNNEWTLSTNNETFQFDHIIFATPANIAEKILKKGECKDKELISVLERFQAEKSDTICHKDSKLMPVDRSLWRCVNFITVKEGCAPMVTIWVNRTIDTFADCPFDVFQTWNPVIKPDPKLVLSNASLWRPIVSLDSDEALKELAALQGRDGLWVCGSWTRAGVPLLEQAARSGIEVAEAIGPNRRPWPVVKREQHSSVYIDSMRWLMYSVAFMCSIGVAMLFV
mmetsp:Transcript_16070/g.27489  ORF Transcript_16070/g.27489 Transcript_16070/m.27489 type:complete len:332 (+) Transcript_16070:3-998(+)